jgi:chemotaxis protein MotB
MSDEQNIQPEESAPGGTRRGSSGGEESGPGVPAWMLTYADTVTLLMTFFVMLMSFSTLDEEKYAKVRGSLMGYMGVVGRTRYNRDGLLLKRQMESGRIFTQGYENPPQHDPMSYLENEFRVRADASSVRNLLRHQLTRQGFEIQIMAGQIFEPGTAQFNDRAEEVLSVIARAVRHLPHQLRVQATGDILFLPSYGFTSRQELAVTRASRVCRYLSDRNVPANRLTIATRVEPDDAFVQDSEPAQVRICVLRPDKKWAL